METPTASDTPDPELAGIEPLFHGVAKTHSREMLIFVISVVNTNQAVAVLDSIVKHHQSRFGLDAIDKLVECTNTIISAYIAKNGWTQEQLAACEQDVKLVWSLAQGHTNLGLVTLANES